MSIMRSLPLGAIVRQLPLGAVRQLRGLGQDEGDTSDFTVPDYTAPDTSLPTYSVTDVTGPDYTNYVPALPTAVGPQTPGQPQISFTGEDLNTAILNGTQAPPAGSALTSQQAAVLNAAGATPDQVGQILSGQISYSAVLNALGAGVSAAATIAKAATLPATSTGLRPSPVTCPTAPAGYAYTLNAANQCILAQSANPLTAASVISGVPNWILLVFGLGAAFALSQAGGK
jgi:hypothetical protein